VSTAGAVQSDDRGKTLAVGIRQKTVEANALAAAFEDEFGLGEHKFSTWQLALSIWSFRILADVGTNRDWPSA
jgi:hypothetical protein